MENQRLLNQIYRAVGDELFGLGLTVVHKPTFHRSLTTDCFKIRMGNIRNVAHDLNAWGMANIDVDLELSRQVAREMSNEFGEIIFDLGSTNELTVTERKYQIDKILNEVPDSISYTEYVRDELRKAGKGFKNCLILSDNEECYQFVDELTYTMRETYEAQLNGNVIFYDKGMKYNVLQSLYTQYFSSKKLYQKKLLFVFYNAFLGSVCYNESQNEFYEVDENSFTPKIALNYYYALDIATYKTITVDVPENNII